MYSIAQYEYKCKQIYGGVFLKFKIQNYCKPKFITRLYKKNSVRVLWTCTEFFFKDLNYG